MTGDYERGEDALPGHKRRQLLLIALASLGAKTLWFSASAVVPQLTEAWRLDGGAQAWLTLSVQLGFVVGAFISASLNLPDRYDPRHVFAFSCALAAMANLALPLLEPPLSVVLWLRGLTGAALAGVYPTGMKLVTTWYDLDRGFVAQVAASGREAFVGRVLLDIAAEDFESIVTRRAAKKLFRRALTSHLGPKPLTSRRLLFRGHD